MVAQGWTIAALKRGARFWPPNSGTKKMKILAPPAKKNPIFFKKTDLKNKKKVVSKIQFRATTGVRKRVFFVKNV